MNGCPGKIARIAALAAGLLPAALAASADDAAPAIPATIEQGPATGRKTALVSRMVLKVVNPDDARSRIVAGVRELGGFPVLVTDDQLEVKVPPERLDELLRLVADEGLVLERTLERQDLTLEIAQLEGLLGAKRAVLSKLRAFFDDSGVQATLRIEQTMTGLVTEIEQVRGRLRVLEERARYARIEVSFRFKERDRLIYVHSPFGWLNTVSLDRFIEEF